MKIIDADALKDKIADLYTEGEEATEGDKAINNVIDIIDNAPEVDLADFYGKAFRNGEENALKIRGDLTRPIYLKQKTPIEVEPFERPLGEWGKWVISEIRCPNCLEYFQTDCYSTEELKKCPNCGTQMRGGGANE